MYINYLCLNQQQLGLMSLGVDRARTDSRKFTHNNKNVFAHLIIE